MAFNPFEAFSVRSKLGRSVMAVLGIVVMLTFVLSTGAVGSGNDFFDQIGNIFSSGKRGEVVATAYGDDVRDTEISDIHRQRRVARDFFALATDLSYTRWAEELGNEVRSGRVSNETRLAVEPFANTRANAEAKPQAYGQFLAEFFQFQSDAQKRYGDALMRARSKPDSDDKKALDAMAAIILYDKRAMPPVFPVMELAGDSDRDAMDFLLLLKKADKMGIQYSEDAVMNLVGRDTGGRLKPKDFERIDKQLRKNDNPKAGPVTSEWIVSGVANEYRARAVMNALQGKSVSSEFARQMGVQRLGQLEQIILMQFLRINPFELPAPGDHGPASAFPGGVTPYEFFEYYKDRCTDNSFEVLEVNAKNFLKQVVGEPTLNERIALFNKYKGELPDPSRDRPGFREPKKLKVEFVTLEANAPRIAQAIPKLQAASLFLCASGGAIAGNPAMALSAAAQPSMAETLPLRKEVAEKLDEVQRPYGMREVFFFEPRDTSIYRPQPIVSALGLLSGQPSISTLATAYASVHQHVERVDHHTRVPFLLQPVLTPFTPTLANAIGMPAFAYALNPKLPPEGLYLPQALAAVKKKQRQELFLADVKELQEKLRKITADPNLMMGLKPEKGKQEKSHTEAKKLLEDWAKDRGLTLAGTTEPRDQYSMVTDPGLKPLNEVALPEPDGTNSLSQKLFAGGDPRARMGSDVQPFHPDWFPSDPAMGFDDFTRSTGLEKPSHLVWVSQEFEPRIYNNLDNANKLTNNEMTKRVDDAWRLEKAKELAKAEADKLAEQVRAIGKTAATDPLGVERQLRDLAVQKDVRLFDLTRMAPLQFEHGTQAQDIRYKPPTLEKTQVLYPTADFTSKLLELRKEPLGTVTVLQDAPRQRYYVACVVGRTEKSVDSFRNVYDKSTAPLGRNPLYDQALGEERFKAVPEVFDRLRAEAGLDLKDAFKNREKKDSE